MTHDLDDDFFAVPTHVFYRPSKPKPARRERLYQQVNRRLDARGPRRSGLV